MGNDCRKQSDNVYFRCRKKAAEKNGRLSSREGAAMFLGISDSSLADYERGVTKFVPVDKVVLMADLYHCPELKNRYCKEDCPIGADLPIATERTSIERAVLCIIQEFSPEKIQEFSKSLIEIASDGEVTDEEKGMLRLLLGLADDMQYALSQLVLTAEKILGE